ncbi:hypothetical protein PPTG_11990 [Plasmopara halstedii]|uniref:Uncharacterized protein n=1 Tax=Plasmopara halstedii TaxID=4781 RepID=A0A0P1ASR3_PLAHL|nr:hypothetical protein PPTG_11990 [Plasmopara halstedii]CEG45158.1 hypothetical protein PPTG_11990 [Plasmopara halstedii]|eukprot:XP_024581527.1 hypothetical protein PPTG_11990 [Plasmopara halstedii]
MSMITTYNVKNNKGVLEGNWVEENALRDKTGYTRRKVPTTLFEPDPRTSRIEPTYERVLLHDMPAALSCNSHASEIKPPQFETTYQASTHYSDFSARNPGPGPRTSLRNESLAETARCLYFEQRAKEREAQERENQEATRTTVSKSSFIPFHTSALVRDRIPRGRNGSMTRQVDHNVQHLTKAQSDSIDRMKLDLHLGAAVTRYSYAVTTGVGLNFPTTVSDGNNVFGRSSTFTNELKDSSKRHGEATEPGCIHDERNGASVHQRSALKRLLVFFKTEPDFARRLLDKMVHGSKRSLTSDCSQEREGYIELSDFKAVFVECGVLLRNIHLVQSNSNFYDENHPIFF